MISELQLVRLVTSDVGAQRETRCRSFSLTLNFQVLPFFFPRPVLQAFILCDDVKGHVD